VRKIKEERGKKIKEIKEGDEKRATPSNLKEKEKSDKQDDKKRKEVGGKMRKKMLRVKTENKEVSEGQRYDILFSKNSSCLTSSTGLDLRMNHSKEWGNERNCPMHEDHYKEEGEKTKPWLNTP
jgi:hypothetical protein